MIAPMDAVEAGRNLGHRHMQAAQGDQAEYDPSLSLLNYAELAHDGDWTLRSALNRLAQPQPARVGALLDLVRRLDAPLHHVRKALEQHTVTCDRALGRDGADGDGPLEPYTDIRTADLARLVAAGADPDQLLTGYQDHGRLDHEEVLAVPLLAIAVRFAQVSALLTAWALVGPDSPPVDAVDETIDQVAAELDRLGVAEETGWR